MRQCLSQPFHAATQRKLVPGMICAVGLIVGFHAQGVAAAALDESFGDVPLAGVALTQSPTQVFALAVQPDGKIIIGGRFDQVAGQSRMEIARLEADGRLDTTFTSPFEMTSVGAAVQTLALDGSGGIFVGGAFMVGGVLKTLAKLNADGSIDGAFVEEPALRLSQVSKILVSGDKLYVASVGGRGLDRLNSNGSFDATFTLYSDTRSYANLDFAPQPGGSLVLSLDEAIVGIGSDGNRASAFTEVLAAYPKLGSLSDGSLLFFANFAEINATAPDKRFARLGTHGGIASSFPVDRSVRTFLGVVSDDKLLIEQQLPGGESIVRLDADGSADGFVVPIDDVVRTIAPYPGGRLVIAGMFGQVEGQPRTRVARLLGTSVGGSGAGGSAGNGSAAGYSGVAGAAGGGAAGDGGTAGDSSTAGDGGTAGNPKEGASGKGGTSAGAGSSAASGGVPAHTPPMGSSGGCAFTHAVSSSSAPAAWLAIGALALLRLRRRR